MFPKDVGKLTILRTYLQLSFRMKTLKKQQAGFLSCKHIKTTCGACKSDAHTQRCTQRWHTSEWLDDGLTVVACGTILLQFCPLRLMKKCHQNIARQASIHLLSGQVRSSVLHSANVNLKLASSKSKTENIQETENQMVPRANHE